MLYWVGIDQPMKMRKTSRAQDKKPTVNNNQNFGSIYGDEAGADRYTEARLSKFAEDVLLSDLDKNSVDFLPNFDNTEVEPEVLPSKVPLALINGSFGIAAGYSAIIPPHNLVEVIDGKADIVVANIIAEIICVLTEDVKRVLKEEGYFITSGIIHDRVDMVVSKLKSAGFDIEEINKDGEWNCIVAKLIQF